MIFDKEITQERPSSVLAHNSRESQSKPTDKSKDKFEEHSLVNFAILLQFLAIIGITQVAAGKDTWNPVIIITESQNQSSWERPLGSPSPTHD